MRKNIASSFIVLIWDIVSDQQTDQIIHWNDNGTSFCISNASVFAEQILTTHFKHTNVSSFVRQLNMYNFHKNKGNTRELEFNHKLFRRDARELLIGIKRKPSQADYRQGQQMLKTFMLKKYNNTSDESKEQVSQHTQNESPFTFSQLSRKKSAFSDQSERPNIFLPDFLITQPPKKILNIIIAGMPLLCSQ